MEGAPETVETSETSETVKAGLSRRRRLRRAIIGCGLTGLALCAGTAYAGFQLINSYEQGITRIPAAFPPEYKRFHPENAQPSVPTDGDGKNKKGQSAQSRVIGANGENWLLVGSDRRSPLLTTGSNAGAPFWLYNLQRSDVLMLVHIPHNGSQIQVLSVPRDSWVPIPGMGRSKINNAFARGGSPLLIETVEQVMRTRVDHFAIMDFLGFESAIDVLGGVDLHDRHLSGQEALSFVRNRATCREWLCGDRGRIERQQAFLRALRAKVTDTGLLLNPLRLDGLIRSLTRSVSVDASVSIRQLAGTLAHMDSGDVRFRTAPSTPAWRGPESVLLLDIPQTRHMWSAMVG